MYGYSDTESTGTFCKFFYFTLVLTNNINKTKNQELLFISIYDAFSENADNFFFNLQDTFKVLKKVLGKRGPIFIGK